MRQNLKVVMVRNIVQVLFVLFLAGCSADDLFDPDAERNPRSINSNVVFADVNLNQEAKDLYFRLQRTTQEGIAFGQQEPFGTGNDFPLPNRLQKDFSKVAGDYPAVVGFDLELISIQTDIDPFIAKFSNAVKDAHEKGSIITMSWHMVNPTRELSFTREDRIVAGLLENGKFRAVFLEALERVATLLKGLKDTEGKSIPVLFRPWHEMNGNFFFWGEGFRTTEEYVQLYRDTIKILSEDYGVHNVLYVYAPNFVSSRSEYLRNYPGDNFVDMLGIDVYDFKNGNFLLTALQNLQIVEGIAVEKNMLFALTETGLTNVTTNNWWTEDLYRAIRSSAITYALIWRNNSTTDFHAPFLGHPSVENFNEFLSKDIMLLRNDIQ